MNKYLTQIGLSYIKALVRFRISSYNLRIETGRYEKERLPYSRIVILDANKTLCKMCNSNKVEYVIPKQRCLQSEKK